MQCSQTFTFFVRRHHCRQCGHVICKECSGGTRGKERQCVACIRQGGAVALPGSLGALPAAELPTQPSSAAAVPAAIKHFTVLTKVARPLGLSFRKQGSGDGDGGGRRGGGGGGGSGGSGTSSDDGKFVVTKVNPGGNAAATRQILPGMVLIKVNGRVVSRLGKAEVAAIIKGPPLDGNGSDAVALELEAASVELQQRLLAL